MSFLKVVEHSWFGKFPNNKTQADINRAEYIRHLDTIDKNITSVEIENIIVTFSKGKLFGEIALLNPDKKVRALSGMTKTDSVLLILNQEAFTMLIEEKLNKEQEIKAKFVYDNFPFLGKSFTVKKLKSNVHILFKEQSFMKGQQMLKEDEVSDKLFIIRKGICSVLKKIRCNTLQIHDK